MYRPKHSERAADNPITPRLGKSSGFVEMITPHTLPHSRADCATARSFFYSSVPEVRRPLSTSQSTFRRSQIEYPTTSDPGRAVPLGPSLRCRDLASHPGAAVLENPV